MTRPHLASPPQFEVCMIWLTVVLLMASSLNELASIGTWQFGLESSTNFQQSVSRIPSFLLRCQRNDKQTNPRPLLLLQLFSSATEQSSLLSSSSQSPSSTINFSIFSNQTFLELYTYVLPECGCYKSVTLVVTFIPHKFNKMRLRYCCWKGTRRKNQNEQQPSCSFDSSNRQEQNVVIYAQQDVVLPLTDIGRHWSNPSGLASIEIGTYPRTRIASQSRGQTVGIVGWWWWWQC